MALQKDKTGDLGNTISYWKVEKAEIYWDKGITRAPSGQLLKFWVQGYHDAAYRADNKVIEAHQYEICGPAFTSAIDGNTSGDLRPALYDWLKAQTGLANGSGTWDGKPVEGQGHYAGLDVDFFSNALDV